jgi:hypothetical protein
MTRSFAATVALALSLSVAVLAQSPNCKSGQYLNPVQGCVNCQTGTYSVGPNATSCTPCPAGTFCSSAAGLCGSCAACSAGTFSAAQATACTACSAGTFSGAQASTCQPCAAGSFSGADASSCSACPVYTYSSSGAASCTTCPAGKFGIQTGQSSCILASAGYYIPTTDCNPFVFPSCELSCTPGHYSNAGASVCSACVQGTFASGSASSSCTACPTGTYGPASGLTVCTTCGTCPTPCSATVTAGNTNAGQCCLCPP